MHRLILIGMLATANLSAVKVRPIEKIKVGKAPHFAQLSHDGRQLFVTAYASSQVWIVDTAGLRRTGEFYGGYEPLGIAASAAGDKIFVTNFNNGLVKSIDADTFEILDDIKVGGRPSNIVVAPNGLEAYVTNFGRSKYGKVDIFDTSTGRIHAEVEVGVTPLAAAVSPLGDRLFVVCGGSNEVVVIDIGSREVIKNIPVGRGPDGIAFSPDGLQIYVANSGTNDLSVIDVLDLEEIRRVPVGSKPFSLAVDPNGRIFVVESGDNAFSILSPDFRKLGTFKVGKRPIDIVLSKEGDVAYVTAEKSNRLFVFQVE